MTRTERQQEAIKKWISNKGRGTIIMPTGMGKTYTSCMAIKALLKKYPGLRVLIVVPTTALKDQWNEKLYEWEFTFNAEVQVINTVIKHSWTCDLLIIDEAHRVASDQFKQIFDCVKYKLILGLTATFDRLDGKQVIISKYCPVVDEVSQLECLANGWISEYKEYQVLLEVDDIEEYRQLNKEFIRYFEFFSFDFGKAMACCGPSGWQYKLKLRDEMYKGSDEEKRKQILQQITVNSIGLMRTMQKRKAFINNHPKKIEVARKIMEARPNSKLITFSNNVKMAEALENGNNVYTGKTSKKKGRVMMEDFIAGNITRLHSCHKLNEGIDVPDISVGIILGTDSSEIKARQRRGRAVRKFGDKQAEIFYLIIKNTVESQWYSNSHKNDKNYITIDEKGLEQVLRGEQPDKIQSKPKQVMFRF